jgi:SnoaL-like domain
MTMRVFVMASVAAAAVTAGSIQLAAQRPQTAQQSVETRLRLIEDRQEIHALLMEYGRTLDGRDFAGFERLFAREAEYGGARNAPVKGPANIRAFLEGQLKKNAAPEPGRDFHLFYNETIDVDGDHATALSKGAFYVRGDGNKLETTAVVNYHDELVREDGRWKFKRRILGEARPAAASAPAQ